ncbi:hypothetical protein V6Z12_D05G005300 [Gossypium hirsutum]
MPKSASISINVHQSELNSLSIGTGGIVFRW